MKRKTGILTSGLFLIMLGIVLLLEKLYIPIPYFVYDIVWPAFFIMLGLELVFSKKLYGEENSGINLGIILLVFLILFFTSEIFYFPPFNFINW
ncbi:MAG TPA: hypothetical protein GXX15_04590 [Clostridia bacterium]|nr:hypothetical protein [Clostridia bacterium]